MQQNGTFIERRNNWIHQAVELNHSRELVEDYLDDMYWFDNYIRLVDRSKDSEYYWDVRDEYDMLKSKYWDEIGYVSIKKLELLKVYMELLADVPDFADALLIATDYKIYAKDW